MKELPKTYEASKYEDSIYKLWEESGFFNPDILEGEPYSIMMPPPNVTGVLHLGHALENSLMDVMARYQRMQGKKVLLLPGTDHAAVATQAKVEKDLVKAGMKNPREELGREGLLEKIREYAENSKSTILSQIKKMGTSCDWGRLAYTFDEDRSKAVNEVFKKMYDDGLIYRGYRVVNWSVKGQSTCSDDELVYIDRKAKFYTFKYSKDFPFTIATTRPETKLGDTAVAVNPKDKRYKKYIGQIFDVNFCGVDLKLKIIADDHVDPEFGTGALGVTPAHSSVDFDMYERKKAEGNEIDLVQVIGEDGNMTSRAGDEFVGKTALEARELVVEKLKAQGLLEAEEEIDQNVGTSDRFGDVVEALPMTQWFVAVNKEIPGRRKTLKQLMKEAVEKGHNGDKNQKVNITPDRFEKIYYNWIDNLRDWCISRQVWWGHQIPVWYRKTGEKVPSPLQGEGQGEVFVGVNPPEDLEDWQQDPDTLDTWFSAGLWTFSTLGWPDSAKATPGKPSDLEQFHPSSWMQMGHEILFFWMARMILMSTYLLDEIPFKDVYIHGMLRDKDGKKFSKSADNGIDPLEVIEKYGTDALRYSLISGISPGNDARFYLEKVEGAQHLVNKLWNMSRFMLMNIDEPKIDVGRPEAKTLADKWTLNSINTHVRSINDSLENYQFSAASELLRSFTWDQIADWYLEIAKIEGSKSEIFNYILNTILKLWHPFVPFVTEQIWNEIYGKDELLMVEKWPQYKKENYVPDDTIVDFDLVKNIITGIRSLKSDYKIDPAKKLSVVISAGDKLKVLEENKEIIIGLARLEELQINKSTNPASGRDPVQRRNKPINSVGFVEGGVEVFVDLTGVVDLDKEKKRLKDEIDNLQKYTKSLEGKLSNKGFVGSAPEEVIVKEKEKLEEGKIKLEKLVNQLKNL
ncbi:MAG: valine--tRNA ligase [Candidatus Magasanikbacteria bacterium]